MKTLSFWIVALLMSSFIVSCGEPQKETNKVKTVKTDTVHIEGRQTLLQYPGKVKASQDITLAFRVSGTILRIFVFQLNTFDHFQSVIFGFFYLRFADIDHELHQFSIGIAALDRIPVADGCSAIQQRICTDA